MCTRLYTKKAELRTTKLDVLSEAQESSILEKSTESLQTTAGSRRLADFFFLHYSCIFYIFLRRTCITSVTGGWEKRKSFRFDKGREMVKEGKELASPLPAAQVSTEDEKRSHLLLGDFHASEPRLDLRKHWYFFHLVSFIHKGKLLKHLP